MQFNLADLWELVADTVPDFEAPTDAGGNNVYDVVVAASDGLLFDNPHEAGRVHV